MALIFHQFRKLGTISLLLLLFLARPFPASAATTASGQTFIPAIDDSHYITTYGAETFQQWQFRGGLYLNYARDPVEFGTGGIRRSGIVDDLLMADAFFSIGIFDWFQVGLDVPVALYMTYYDPNSPLQPNPPKQTITQLGDVRFEMKFRLLDIYKHSFGVSLLPFATFPTGDGDKFIGNNTFSGGLKAIAEGNIRDRFWIALNLGYQIRDAMQPATNLLQDDYFLYGLGMSFKAVDWLYIIGDLYGAAVAKQMFSNAVESPLEGALGLRFIPMEGLKITAGGAIGFTRGYGTPEFRAILGASYTKPRVVALPEPPPPPPAPVEIKQKQIVITKKIHFEFDKATIRPISFHIMDAIADILQNNPNILRVSIEGHTDSKGSDEYNQKLSEDRASAVRGYLIAHGIDSSRLVAVGQGESQPIATNETALGRARNRRVEFHVEDASAETISEPVDESTGGGDQGETPQETPATPEASAPPSLPDESSPPLPSSPEPPATTGEESAP